MRQGRKRRLWVGFRFTCGFPFVFISFFKKDKNIPVSLILPYGK